MGRRSCSIGTTSTTMMATSARASPSKCGKPLDPNCPTKATTGARRPSCPSILTLPSWILPLGDAGRGRQWFNFAAGICVDCRHRQIVRIGKSSASANRRHRQHSRRNCTWCQYDSTDDSIFSSTKNTFQSCRFRLKI